MESAHADTTRLEIRELDLGSYRGWKQAADGCRYLIHVASPFVLAKPDHPEDLIRPAVDGAVRATESAIDAGVERVVMTSSLATVQFAPASRGHVYTENDWTDPHDPKLNAYTTSKVRAELAALAVARRRGYSQHLAFINPGAVIGRLLTEDPGTSVVAIQRIMSGAFRMIPDLRLPWVDVRDIADAHVAAMTSPVAAGRRTIVSTDTMSLIQVARVIRERIPEARAKMPKVPMPTWLTWAASLVEPQLKGSRWLIGQEQKFDRSGAEKLLERPLRSIPDAIEAGGAQSP